MDASTMTLDELVDDTLRYAPALSSAVLVGTRGRAVTDWRNGDRVGVALAVAVPGTSDEFSAMALPSFEEAMRLSRLPDETTAFALVLLDTGCDGLRAYLILDRGAVQVTIRCLSGEQQLTRVKWTRGSEFVRTRCEAPDFLLERVTRPENQYVPVPIGDVGWILFQFGLQRWKH